jgi:hypothetical protein
MKCSRVVLCQFYYWRDAGRKILACKLHLLSQVFRLKSCRRGKCHQTEGALNIGVGISVCPSNNQTLLFDALLNVNCHCNTLMLGL